MTNGKLILVAILLYFTVVITFIVYLLFYTEFSDWLVLASLFLSGVIILGYGLNAILKMLGQPKLKIIGSKIESCKVDTEGEYKDVYFLVKNVGGQEAIDCLIRAKVKDTSETPYYVVRTPFSLQAGNDRPIHFQQVIKSEQKIRPLSNKNPTLDRGRIYDYEITFFSANFKDEKKHRLKLDLTSWENIKVILDC